MRFRFADLDGLGHINSVRLAELVEDGRMRVIQAMPLTEDTEFMLVSLTMQFLAPPTFAENIVVRSCLIRIGRSSCTLSHELRQAKTVVVRAESVVVHIDRASHKAIPLTEDQREFLQ